MSAVMLLSTAILTALIFPSSGVMLVGFLLILQAVIVMIRFAIAPEAVPRMAQHTADATRVFSVHVATHNEPAQMVAHTLTALAGQTYPPDRFEVVVMDNNTSDPALWRPIEELCQRLGPRFHFMHRTGVQGAKAGALNIALAGSRDDATHIVTVDADYVVSSDFLAQAARALDETGADYVQFPQAYTGCDTVAVGVDAELEEYFRTNARMADGSEAVLLTGTLCVISKEALVAAGGWSGQTTTEDAEMGVRLCRRGYSGRFVDRVVGRGFLPFSLRDLERQRHRWASGNLQTLIAHAPAILLGRDAMGWQRRGAILAQLTAWLNLSLVPALILIAALLTQRSDGLLVTLAAASVLLSFVDIVARLIRRGLRDGATGRNMAAAICHRLALAPVAAIATFEVIAGRPMEFVVTDKTGKPSSWRCDLPTVGLALFALATLAIPAALEAGIVVTLATFVLMLPFPAALATARTLDLYRAILTAPNPGASA